MKNEQIHPQLAFRDYRALLMWAAKEHGDRSAFSWQEDGVVRRVSYRDLLADVRALSAELYAQGVWGKHVLLVGKLSYEWVLLYYATMIAGGVLVPLDRDWTAAELADTAASAEASFLFFDADLTEKAEYVHGALSHSQAPIFLGGESGEIRALLTAGKEKLGEGEAWGALPETDPRAMSLLVFTSGTTGKGKGVMLCQDGILRDVCAVTPYVAFRERTLGNLPPHHTYGSSVLIVGHVVIGCEVYISAGLRHLLKEMKEQRPGHLVLVPLYLETFYRRILASVKEKGKERLVRMMIRLSNALRRVGIDCRRRLFAGIREAFGGEISMVICGGAPLNAEIVAFFEAIGISVLNGYGITECSPIIAVNRSRHVVAGSVGTVLDINHVRIDSPNHDGEGEILVKGQNVMLGYYRDAAATAEAIGEDGYFRTGDYGKLRGDGILTITGRKKNLIILSNGKNVYPEEIESVFIAVPGVQDVVVYEGQSRRGISYNAIVCEIRPDAEYLEKNGITDADAYLRPYVEAYNRTAVAYKKIAIFKVRTEDFPKNTLRKIMRFKMDMTID